MQKHTHTHIHTYTHTGCAVLTVDGHPSCMHPNHGLAFRLNASTVLPMHHYYRPLPQFTRRVSHAETLAYAGWQLPAASRSLRIVTDPSIGSYYFYITGHILLCGQPPARMTSTHLPIATVVLVWRLLVVNSPASLSQYDTDFDGYVLAAVQVPLIRAQYGVAISALPPNPRSLGCSVL